MRNFPALTAQEQQILGEKRVLILGCGGLGGYLCEYLVRLGVGHITAADPDRFDASNLNRQILSSAETLGRGKAQAARQRASAVNADVQFRAVEAAFNADTAENLLADADLVLDALDTAADRLLLEDACAAAGLTLVHGAVQGWMAQVAVVTPGSGALHRLYGGGAAAGVGGDRSCLAFTPAWCAAVQAAEAVRLLVGRPASLAGRLLLADLQTMDVDVIQL